MHKYEQRLQCLGLQFENKHQLSISVEWVLNVSIEQMIYLLSVVNKLTHSKASLNS